MNKLVLLISICILSAPALSMERTSPVPTDKQLLLRSRSLSHEDVKLIAVAETADAKFLHSVVEKFKCKIEGSTQDHGAGTVAYGYCNLTLNLCDNSKGETCVEAREIRVIFGKDKVKAVLMNSIKAS